MIEFYRYVLIFEEKLRITHFMISQISFYIDNQLAIVFYVTLYDIQINVPCKQLKTTQKDNSLHKKWIKHGYYICFINCNF